MSKYYDLDKLKDMIEAKAETLIGDGAIAFHAVAKWLDFLPAADVAPVRHGRWIKKKDEDLFFLECSLCGRSLFDTIKDVFCPYCGAKMDEEAAP